MKITFTRTKSSTTLYVTKSYRRANGKYSSKVIERLGTLDEIKLRSGDQDPVEWAKEYAKKLTLEEKNANESVTITFSAQNTPPKDKKKLFNAGYLFLNKIYNELNIKDICSKISARHKFKYDLNDLVSNLIFSRILFPSSKKSTFEDSRKYIFPAKYDLQHVYRALSVLAQENDTIQAEVFKNSQKVMTRKTGVMYYDCTNFFFELEHAEGLKQYGISKENRPNPIVQMGLFMDINGLPVAFNITPGNTNEQTTLIPLQKKIEENLNIDRMVICTDAGLSSYNNRKFNNVRNRGFITTLPLKKQNKLIQNWALDDDGWYSLKDKTKVYKISEINESQDITLYKERWFNENGLEQRVIVSYSTVYKRYQRKVREEHIKKAQKAIITGTAKLNNKRDYKRYLQEEKFTQDGELAKFTNVSLNESKIFEDSIWDGFYAVSTNMEDKANEIVKIIKWRWKIEQCFRIMKTEFKARPVYLKRDDRIIAHFLICYLSLLIYRILEERMENIVSGELLVKTLKDMNFLELKGDGYTPVFERTALTDKLEEVFDLHINKDLVTKKMFKKIKKM